MTFKPKNIVFTVTNDLNYDQRMRRICSSLQRAGHQITLVGRIKPKSKPLDKLDFAQHRLSMWFSKGKLFYVEYNIRLFIYLLFEKYDVIGAIDLDSILACSIASKLKGVPFTYDAHEYFAELPEIVVRPRIKKFWKRLEQFAVPKAIRSYTVCNSYAQLFEKEYKKPFEIIRNATVLEEKAFPVIEEPYILYQGAVNVGRGVEEMIQAMPQIDCKMIVCGKGDNYETCRQLVRDLKLEDKVFFKGFVPPQELKTYTLNAYIGFTLFSDEGVSYKLSLANRFFDYIHSAVPQIAIDFPEYRRINDQYEVAVLVEDLTIDKLAEAANAILENRDTYDRLRNNCLKAREKYNWQEEEKKLVAIYESF